MSIFDEVKNNPKYNPANSHTWFWNNVRMMASGIGPMAVLGSMIKNQKHAPSFGKMYLYTYAPKHKDKLPYYDTFPLVIPFSRDAKTFTGLNLHYIDPFSRAYVLEIMKSNFMNNKKMDETTVMKMTWEQLKRSPIAEQAEKCVKRYLYGYVKSMFVEIPIQDWPIAVYLPVERFKPGGLKGTPPKYRK